MDRRSGLLLFAAGVLSIAASLALYQPALRLGLLSDDFALLMWARRLELMPRDWGQIRPLPIVAWWALAQTTAVQATPGALHTLNIALHGVNAALVGLLATRLTSSRAAAIAAGAIFLTMPIAVEPVAWASGVFDVMLATFALVLGVVATARSQLTRTEQGLCLLLTIAMLATKETGVVAGPLLLLFHWTRWGRVDRSAAMIAVAQVVITGVYAVGRELTGRLDPRLTPRVDPAGIGRLLSGVGRAFSVPLHRDILVGHPLIAIACVVAVTGGVTAWLIRSRHSPSAMRLAVLAAAGTVLCVAPAIRIFGITPDLQGSRYVYLASTWWSMVLGAALVDGWQERRARIAAGAMALLVVFGAAMATRAHLEPWTAARHERDRILLRLIGVPPSCRQVAATPATDNVRGAYVFRNGLNEALATLGRSYEWVDNTHAAPECRVDLTP